MHTTKSQALLALLFLCACGPTTGTLSRPDMPSEPPPSDIRTSAFVGVWNGTYRGSYNVESPAPARQDFTGTMRATITPAQSVLVMDLSALANCTLTSVLSSASRMTASGGQTCVLNDAASGTSTRLTLVGATGSLSGGYLDEAVTANFVATGPRGTSSGLFLLDYHASK